jgi:hypothetical protein
MKQLLRLEGGKETLKKHQEKAMEKKLKCFSMPCKEAEEPALAMAMNLCHVDEWPSLRSGNK